MYEKGLLLFKADERAKEGHVAHPEEEEADEAAEGPRHEITHIDVKYDLAEGEREQWRTVPWSASRRLEREEERKARSENSERKRWRLEERGTPTAHGG